MSWIVPRNAAAIMGLFCPAELEAVACDARYQLSGSGGVFAVIQFGIERPEHGDGHQRGNDQSHVQFKSGKTG